MFARPTSYVERQTSPAAFGEAAMVLRRLPGQRDSNGEWAEGAEEQLPISAATAPGGGGGGKGSGGRRRKPGEEGVRREGDRRFWTATPLVPATTETDGDRIVWADQVWRVIAVGAWGGTYEALAVLVDAETP